MLNNLHRSREKDCAVDMHLWVFCPVGFANRSAAINIASSNDSVLQLLSLILTPHPPQITILRFTYPLLYFQIMNCKYFHLFDH